jgi:hypothetical protein
MVLHYLRSYKEKRAADIGANSASLWLLAFKKHLTWSQQRFILDVQYGCSHATDNGLEPMPRFIDGVTNLSDRYIRHSNQGSSVTKT